LSRDDLEGIVGRAGVAYDQAWLDPVLPDRVLLRMLVNLRAAYLQRSRPADALWAVELMQLIEPREESLVRDRALLLAAVGRDADADRVATGYRADRPDDPERADLFARLDAIRRARRRQT
jgi:regulator of sirC expression with transglutaminase-like and TPR domain